MADQWFAVISSRTYYCDKNGFILQGYQNGFNAFYVDMAQNKVDRNLIHSSTPYNP